MKKLPLIIGITLAGGLVLFFLLSPPQPTYHGRTITQLQDDWAAKKSSDFSAALKAIGTNALPYVVQNLAQNESSARSNYTSLQAKLPGPLQKLFAKPKPLLQEADGPNVFSNLGSNSLPSAIALLHHDSPTVRRAAAYGISSLRRKSPTVNQAMPALIGALTDTDRMVRFYAALALKEMGADASNAVPALTKVVADAGVGSQRNDFFYLRAAAAVALGKIGPPSASALPVLQTALQEPNSYLRGQAAVAIWRINSDVHTALPVLLREMPANNEHSKWDWVIALGEMGPRAKAALPQLRTELQQDHDTWILAYVTNALNSIAPKTNLESDQPAALTPPTASPQ